VKGLLKKNKLSIYPLLFFLIRNLKEVMKNKMLILFTLLIFLLISCDNDVNGPAELIVYYNSFEYPLDTLEWEGISYSMFTDDPAPGGGNKSLLIGGGCVVPTARVFFETPNEETKYRIGFWAKMADTMQTAEVRLVKSEGQSWDSEDLVETVSGTEWQMYYSDSLFHCPPNGRFELQIFCGGIISAQLYIDKLGLVLIE